MPFLTANPLLCRLLRHAEVTVTLFYPQVTEDLPNDISRGRTAGHSLKSYPGRSKAIENNSVTNRVLRTPISSSLHIINGTHTHKIKRKTRRCVKCRLNIYLF